MKRSSIPVSIALAAATVCVAVAAMASACAGSSGGDLTTSSVSQSGSSTTEAAPPTSETATPGRAIAKSVSPDGVVTLGNLETEGFAIVLPPEAYPGVAGASATVAASTTAPPMRSAALMGDGYDVDTGGTGRLDVPGTFTFRYNPAILADASLFALGYFDGTDWTYTFASAFGETANTVSFPLYHFSAFYRAEFENELRAAEYYVGQMAAQSVLGEGGGDPQVAAQTLADLITSKLGLGENESARQMMAEIASGEDILKLVTASQAQGWTDNGYQAVMLTMCGKVADRLVAAAASGGSSSAGGGFAQMWDVVKAGKSTGAFVSLVSAGDNGGAGKELLNLVTDGTGTSTKALQYALKGMQNAVEVWRDVEVESAFKVYSRGSTSDLFGYGAVQAGDFETIWTNMKGAAGQLCVDRIAKESSARQLVGLPPLTAKEGDLYRAEIKQQLKSEFDRRIALKDLIDLQRNNLELIFTELDTSKLFEGTNVWIRKTDPNETLDSRLHRFNDLIGRIFKDLAINTVYSDPQQEGALNGRISAVAMTEMLRGYFAASTQAEGEAFLQDYYTRFPGQTVEGIDGNWLITVNINGAETVVAYTLAPSGPTGGTVANGAGTFAYTFSDNTIVFTATSDKPNTRDYRETYTLKIAPTAHGYAGTGTMVQAYIAETRDAQGNLLTSEPVSNTWQITAVKASS